MGPDPDYTLHVGPLLIRRWGKWVRIDWRFHPGQRPTFAFNLPGRRGA